MKKKRAIRDYILLALATIIGVILCCCTIPIPFTDYKFTGFAKGIQLGLDLKGGMVAVYDAKMNEDSEGDFDSQLDATITRLSDLITADYSEATVVKQGSNQIRIEVPDVDDPDEVLDVIGEPALLEIKKEDSSTAPAVVTGKHIKEVKASQQEQNGSYVWGVSVTFNGEGTKLFSDLTTEFEGKPIYIYLGGEKFQEVTVQSVITNGQTFISGSMNSQSQAEAYAMKILSGTYSVTLSLSEKSTVSATLGTNALKYGLIAGAIGLALIFVVMVIVYGYMGLVADFSLIIYTVLVFAALALIPSVQLTLPGIAGIILGLGMAVDANILIFERVRDEYKTGKRIQASIKSGFRKSISAILDSNITTILASIVLMLLGTGAIKGFAITLLIGIVASMFCALLVSRLLLIDFYYLVGNKPKAYHLTREAHVDEIN